MSRIKNSRRVYRYAPQFSDQDRAGIVANVVEECPTEDDTNVSLSTLDIHFKSSSTAGTRRLVPRGLSGEVDYNRAKRGEIELQIATKLGSDGFEVLERLSILDDEIVDRLCRAYASGAVGQRELAAARLAARQAHR